MRNGSFVWYLPCFAWLHWHLLPSRNTERVMEQRRTELAIVRDLPKVGYVTFLDALFVASFFCILEITTVFLMQ